MRLHHLISTSVLTLALGAGLAFADGARPEPVQPESVSATQYVDKKGCLFVRAAAGAANPWVLSPNQPVCTTAAFRTKHAHVQPEGVTNRVRVGPKSAPRKIAEARAIKPPRGFRAAFDDGRLNPLSGVGTRRGKAQMGLIWSDTVPRYLIDVRTGRRIR